MELDDSGQWGSLLMHPLESSVTGVRRLCKPADCLGERKRLGPAQIAMSCDGRACVGVFAIGHHAS